MSVLVTYLGGDGWTVAGMNAVTAHGVHWIPHDGGHSRARRQTPVG